jgi:hypothetical protein
VGRTGRGLNVTAHDAETGGRDLVEGREWGFAARVTVLGADFVWS